MGRDLRKALRRFGEDDDPNRGGEAGATFSSSCSSTATIGNGDSGSEESCLACGGAGCGLCRHKWGGRGGLFEADRGVRPGESRGGVHGRERGAEEVARGGGGREGAGRGGEGREERGLGV